MNNDKNTDSYIIYDYFKEHVGVLITLVSMTFALISFLLHAIYQIVSVIWLRNWNVTIDLLVDNSSARIYSSILTAIALILLSISCLYLWISISGLTCEKYQKRIIRKEMISGRIKDETHSIIEDVHVPKEIDEMDCCSDLALSHVFVIVSFAFYLISIGATSDFSCETDIFNIETLIVLSILGGVYIIVWIIAWFRSRKTKGLRIKRRDVNFNMSEKPTDKEVGLALSILGVLVLTLMIMYTAMIVQDYRDSLLFINLVKLDDKQYILLYHNEGECLLEEIELSGNVVTVHMDRQRLVDVDDLSISTKRVSRLVKVR